MNSDSNKKRNSIFSRLLTARPSGGTSLSTAPHALSSSGAKRVWTTLAVLSALLIFGGHSFGDRNGLLIGFFASLALVSLVVFYCDFRLVDLFPSFSIEGQDPWGVLSSHKEIGRKLGFTNATLPAVRMIECASPLAFSAGVLLSRTTLFISNELVERLSREEMRAVLTYELIRVRTRMTSTTTASSALTGTLALAANAIDNLILLRFLSRSRREKAAWNLINGPVTLVISPLVALLARISVSRNSIFDLDREVVAMIGQPDVFAKALWKLDAYNKTRPTQVNFAEAHLFVVSPLSRHRRWGFTRTHPPIEKRISELVGHYPL